LLPYGANPDPALAARFEALGQLGPETFGRTYYVHFKKNNYPFPGEPKGLNAAFAIPHDSAHVLSGYDTTPRGEILVSTFTAAMHPKNPMAGHVLPVIFTWQLDNTLNQVAGGVKDALDPREFWHAWAAGTATKMDTFTPGWDFWGYARQALGDVRERLGVPRAGLDSRATGGS
jgi:ubiquinone biosynthesis protein Coq4